MTATPTLTPTPVTPAPGASLVIRKFYDQNGNGRLDPDEAERNFFDLDDDGELDPDEPLLSGWTYTVTVDGRTFELITDEAGMARRGDLACGQTLLITERVELKSGGPWVVTTGNPRQVTLQCGENTVLFGNLIVKLPITGRANDEAPFSAMPGSLVGNAAGWFWSILGLILVLLGLALALRREHRP